MSTSPRALGIDFGEKRIGLAVSDPEGRWALPLTTLERQTDRRAAYAIANIARTEEVQVLVLGEPLGDGGEVGEAALRIRRFGERLRRAARMPVVRVDERLTTIEASERLRQAGLESRTRPREAKKQDAKRDTVAAQILLQEALDQGSVARALEIRVLKVGTEASQ